MSSELPTVLRGWQITQAKKKRAAGNSRGPKSQSEIVLLFDPLRKTVQRKRDTICQNLPESNSKRANKARESFGCNPRLAPGWPPSPAHHSGFRRLYLSKGADPAARSPTATLLRLHPNHE